jgi:hypothetical protein
MSGEQKTISEMGYEEYMSMIWEQAPSVAEKMEMGE